MTLILNVFSIENMKNVEHKKRDIISTSISSKARHWGGQFVHAERGLGVRLRDAVQRRKLGRRGLGHHLGVRKKGGITFQYVTLQPSGSVVN